MKGESSALMPAAAELGENAELVGESFSLLDVTQANLPGLAEDVQPPGKPGVAIPSKFSENVVAVIPTGKMQVAMP